MPQGFFIGGLRERRLVAMVCLPRTSAPLDVLYLKQDIHGNRPHGHSKNLDQL